MFTAAKKETPSYYVIKDLFDAVDIKKDGQIDSKEWNQTFNNLEKGSDSTIKPTALDNWENGEECIRVGSVLAKHRKALLELFA